MDEINDLLEYLPKGSIDLFFKKVGSYYYDCIRMQTLAKESKLWFEVNISEKDEKLPSDSDSWVHIHCGDKIQVDGHLEGAFITKIQNIAVPVSLTCLVGLISKEKFVALLLEIRDWVYSLEGKKALASLPH